VHEILEIPVRSQLVFLSGCETGLGTAGLAAAAPGEDFATLSRAFLYAGAGGVAATLWPVADDGAARFAARFYERLAADGPAGALAGAQRAMRADPRTAHPYYWAGYQVAGSDGWTAGTTSANRSAVSVLH
jgi:CHAT domain-containing protein